LARNGSGTYTVVNTFVSGNPITAAGHNQNWADLASELTNSVAVDGQSTMTGQLKASTGTAAAPSYTFSGDLNCGFYRIGADNIGAACAGAKVLDVSATGLGITGTLTTSGAITATATSITAGTTVLAGDSGFSFTSDTNSGLYRVGADNISLAVNGADVINIQTTGAVVTGTLTATGALSAASVTGSMVATQAAQETGTSTTTAVTPGRQHFHPSASKFWLKCDNAGNLASPSYNITSIGDTGPGVITVTIATDFDDADYAVVAVTGTGNVSPYISNAEQAVGSFIIRTFNTNSGAAQDSLLGIYAVGFGDLP
jgi:hypothetical protein